mgnify:CR=1|jgi:hypothetical protein|tara:strand:+ start:145 stop:342 length:198 start_codon:yes stop_codon:yes gene_type:complete
MKKYILTATIITAAIISFYFIFSPYQNCKRDYVNEWIDREETRGKYVSNLDIKERMEFCVTNSSW